MKLANKLFLALFCAGSFTPAYAQQQVENSDLKATTSECMKAMQSGSALMASKCVELKSLLSKNKEKTPEKLEALAVYVSFSNSRTISKNDINTLKKEIFGLKDKSPEADASRARAGSILASLHLRKKEYNLASRAASDSILSFEKANNLVGIVDGLSLLSEIQRLSGDKSRALLYATQTADVVEKIPRDIVDDYARLKFMSDRSLAHARFDMNMLNDAIKPAISASDYVDSIDPNKLSTLSLASHNLVASLYLKMEKPAEAIGHAKPLANHSLDPKYPLTPELMISVMNLLQAYKETVNNKDSKVFIEKFLVRINGEKDSAMKIKGLGISASYYMNTDDKKDFARDLIVKATIMSYKLFGSDSEITNELAEMADALETMVIKD